MTSHIRSFNSFEPRVIQFLAERYTRSQSVGLGSKPVFDDLKKLGADNSYLRKLLKDQVK